MRLLYAIVCLLVGCADMDRHDRETTAARQPIEVQQDAAADPASSIFEEAILAAVGYHQLHNQWPDDLEALLADFVAQHGPARFLDEHRLREVRQEDDGKLRLTLLDQRVETVLHITPPVMRNGEIQVDVRADVRPLEPGNDRDFKRPSFQLFRDPL